MARSGTRLGPYEIGALLGTGGMGEVYRARDTRLGREVAIKVLTGEAAEDGAARLLREARSASALNHPNICTLHEIGEDGGRPFLVMELVEGEGLDRRIGERGLPLTDVLRLGTEIAEGLAHAHARGVVHRDLKSGNVAITSDGRAKILDFGIARMDTSGEAGDATRTAATLVERGQIAGTLAYMAPEVLQGEPADARSDLWALGVMLVEMATGTRPFRGDTGFALSTAILRDPPEIPPSIPPPLREVIARLLAKDPADRWQTAADVAAALRQIAAAAPPAPASVPVGAQRRIGAAAALVVVLGLAVFGAWWWVGPAPIDSIAVLPLDNLSNDPNEQYFADGMTESLISELSAIEQLRVISRTSVMRFRAKTQDLTEIADTLGVDGIVEGTVLRSGDTVRITARLFDTRRQRQIWRGSYERPLSDAIALQRDLATTIGREIRGQLTPADEERLERQTEVDPDAYQAYLKGRFQWNLRRAENLKQAERLFQEAISKDPAFARAYAGLADVYVVQGDNRDRLPSEAYGRARTAVENALRIDPLLAEAHTTRAWLAFAIDRDWEAAAAGFDRALELNAGYATAHQWRGEFLGALGRFDEALASLQRAHDLDPLALMPQAVHGWVAYLAGRYTEAISLCEDVLALDPSFRPARMYRAWTYMEQNRLDEAEAEIKTLLETTTSRAVPVATLGRIAARRGNHDAARRALDELLALPYPPSFDIAKVYAELRDRDEALQWLGRAEAERSSAALYVKVDPTFTWLRGDPAFEALLERLHLDANE